MPVNFTVVGHVLSKTGPPSHRVATVQHKDGDEVLQEIEIIYWEDVELSALPDTVYLISGAVVLREQLPSKVRVRGDFFICKLTKYSKIVLCYAFDTLRPSNKPLTSGGYGNDGYSDADDTCHTSQRRWI